MRKRNDSRKASVYIVSQEEQILFRLSQKFVLIGANNLVKYGPPSTAQLNSLQDVLNSIISPRARREGDKLWVQYASTTPATNTEVVLHN